MGRLLRKKSPAKKKTQGSDRAASQLDGGTDAKDIAPVSVASNDLQKKPPVPRKTSPVIDTESYLGKATLFLREVRAELKKVTWPSRKQTIGSTVVVIVLVAIISLFLGVVDVALSGVIRVVLG